ncbi:EndoU domain-containing protein [Phytomonospora sp. NPDC050363]|uniref:EndoU domain-containing protein n=1 Tax=Phytomonospora sp. NPDC050363 TaxID=3155642 RepID=UPI0033D19728
MAKKKGGGGSGPNPVKLALKYLDKFKHRPGRGDRMSGKGLRHQQHGELKTDAETGARVGRGYHSRPGGNDFDDRRTTEVTQKHPNGVYSGKVEFKNDNPPPEWVPKQGDGTSAFFPDDWDSQKIDNATSDAFANGKKDPVTGTWTGTHDGVKIEGWYDPATGNIGHGFPSFNQ